MIIIEVNRERKIIEVDIIEEGMTIIIIITGGVREILLKERKLTIMNIEDLGVVMMITIGEISEGIEVFKEEIMIEMSAMIIEGE